jgi:phasin family protein
MLTVEQIVSTQKDQAAAFYALANQAVTGVERLTDLNLKALKSTMADSAAQTEALFSVKDVQGMLALQNSDLKAAAEKASAYSRELYEIASGFGGEFAKAAEARAAEAQKQINAFVDSAVKNAPKGTEQAVAALQSAVATAGTAFESVQKAVKQASEQAAASIETMTHGATSTATVTDVKAKKAA